MRWYRYSVVVIGRESNEQTAPLEFIRFRHHRDAVDWCVKMNDVNSALYSLTYYQVVALP